MDNDPELDPIRKEIDEDALLEDLAEEFMNGDPDDALARAEELGYDIDDLPLWPLIHSETSCKNFLSGDIINLTTE